MDSISLILHVLAASALVGGEILLILAVLPATSLIDDQPVRRSVTRIVTRRFARITIVSLVVLLITGLYQFFQMVPTPIRENIQEFRWGPVFTTKMALFGLMLILIGIHGMYLGPRIARAYDLASSGDANASLRLTNLRRSFLLVSLILVIVTIAVMASGVILGNHEYSYLESG